MALSRKRLRMLALAGTLAVGLAFADAAQAGCLIENDDCSRCAQNVMRDAIRDRSPRLLRRSLLMLADCSIDLFHCIWRGQHHSYPCAL